MVNKNYVNENMNIVIVGHVDHGKSTIIGKLLADTNSLPVGKLEQVKETCRRNSKPFEYAFLLDALKDEQAQGITIDSARVFFKTDKRKYIIIDAPGHIEFLKNMVTGAARAEAALLVIDAKEGVMENSKRHGYLLSMLGIKQVVVLVNKMDLIDYNQQRYDEIAAEYNRFLTEIGVKADSFIPVSGFMGDNVALASDKMSWYEGKTVLEKLDLLKNKQDVEYQAFRMPVQGVYKFTAGGDDRRIVAGSVDSGKVKVGDEVIFYPSGKESRVKTVERFNAPEMDEDSVGSASGFTLEEQIYIARGELACKKGETTPQVAKGIKTKLFWLGREDLNNSRSYFIKIGTQKVRAYLEEVVTVLDAVTLSKNARQSVKRHEVAEVIFRLEKAIAFDKAESLKENSRFVIVDNYEISGGGIVVDSLEEEHRQLRENNAGVYVNWLESAVTKEERAVRYAQRPALILVSGKKDLGQKAFAKYLERGLFMEGRNTFYLDLGDAFQNIDTTAINAVEKRNENLRSFAKMSSVLLHAGNIVIVTVTDIRQEELDTIAAAAHKQSVKLLWVGDAEAQDLHIDLLLKEHETKERIYSKVKKMLIDAQIIFQPYDFQRGSA